MNVNGDVLQRIENSNVETSSTVNFNKNIDAEASLQELIVFKRSVKYAKYINLFFKRAMDICGAIVGIVFLIPITIVVAIIETFIDEGPLFYTQERIGEYGKIFAMYKFRSMVVGADEKLKELLENDEEARKEYKKYKKLTNDPRITKIGKFLRKTSLDEFPQFINVLKGEMSLVGPRPYLTREKKDMGDKYNVIITMKPGITGIWQIQGRSEVSFEERIKLDYEYYQNKNLIYDVKILFKTILSIMKHKGAV